jgi:hypothetical protein
MSRPRACSGRRGPKRSCTRLSRDEQLQGERLPRSSRTIYRILHQAGRIAHRLPHLQEPLERPAPMSQWQLDVKDAATVPADPDGKRQHVVEVLNTVDEGTSVLVEAQVGADFHAATTVGAVAELFVRHGLPEAVRRDRDVRFVSRPAGSDFPSAQVALLEVAWESVCSCVIRAIPNKMALSRGTIGRSRRNVWRCNVLELGKRCVRPQHSLCSTPTMSARIKG